MRAVADLVLIDGDGNISIVKAAGMARRTGKDASGVASGAGDLG
jgi:hypothetical protein